MPVRVIDLLLRSSEILGNFIYKKRLNIICTVIREKPFLAFLPTPSYLSTFKPGQKATVAITTAQFASRKENEIKY